MLNKGSAWCVAALALALPVARGGSVPDAAGPADSPPLGDVTFVALDTETTGLSPARDRVMEIAVRRFRGDQVLAERSWLIDPGVPIPPDVQRLTGITSNMVAGAPSFAQVFPDVREFLGDAVILVQNAPFDVRFLSAELARHGLAAPTNAVLDSIPLFRAWFPHASRHSLAYLTQYLAITNAQPHRAMSDTAALEAVYLCGVTNLPPPGTLDQLIRLAGGTRHLGAGAYAAHAGIGCRSMPQPLAPPPTSDQ